MATIGPTRQQLLDALFLLDRAGYSTEYMTARFSQLGAKMRERSGRVEDWLAGMNRVRISKLIAQLKEQTLER